MKDYSPLYCMFMYICEILTQYFTCFSLTLVFYEHVRHIFYLTHEKYSEGFPTATTIKTVFQNFLQKNSWSLMDTHHFVSGHVNILGTKPNVGTTNNHYLWAQRGRRTRWTKEWTGNQWS